MSAATAPAALYFHYGIGPWLGVGLAIILSIALGAFLGALAFRYGISGVYFTLLTIAFAEFARIGFDHLSWTGGSAGLFLKVAQRDRIDLVNLRGPPAMYYYVILALTALACGFSAWLLRRRPGYYWQAIRENEEAARALGINTIRWKILAVVISAAMTAVAGVFLAFYYNNLFPEQIFNINRSVEIILGPIVGGMGTLFGPIIGAALMTLLTDGATELVAALGWNIPGVKQLIYGLILLVVVVFLPEGIWPAMARKLKLDAMSLLEVRNVDKSFSGLRAVRAVSFSVAANSIAALIGPNGAGKTTLFNLIAGALAPDSGTISFADSRSDGLRPDQICARGIARTFQIVKPFAGLSVLDNVIVGALHRAANVAMARAHAQEILAKLGLASKRDLPAATLTLPDRKRLEVARALATQPKLLLLDEAMAGLRPTECDQMVAVLREINQREGITILLIEHVMRAVMALADKVIVLHHGEIIGEGVPGEVVRQPAVVASYLGENSGL